MPKSRSRPAHQRTRGDQSHKQPTPATYLGPKSDANSVKQSQATVDFHRSSIGAVSVAKATRLDPRKFACAAALKADAAGVGRHPIYHALSDATLVTDLARRRSLCLAWSETCSRSGASTRRVSERTWVAGSFLPPDLRRCSSCPHGGVSSQQHGGRPGPPMTVDARPNYRGSGDAAAYGLDGCLDAVLEVEFREDAGDVVVDGVGAERELVRDLAIGSAAG